MSRQNKTEKDLLKEMKRGEDIRFIKDKFYPAVVNATVSVDEAGMLLQAMSALVMEEAMETLNKTKVKDVKNRMVKKLAPNDERLLQIEALVNLFDEKTLFDARGHCEGLKAVIEQMKIEHFQATKLSDLTPDWGRYLHE